MRKNRKPPLPNSGSTADIAFLLLIFFMVATTFKREKILSMHLPPPYDGPIGQVPDTKVLEFLINTDNEIMFEKEMDAENTEAKLFQELNKLINRKVSPTINIKVHPDSKYDTYTQILSQIKKVRKEINRHFSDLLFGKKLKELNEIEFGVLKKKTKIKITELEIS